MSQSQIQEMADKYTGIESVQLAICEIARLSHTGKHGQRIKELLEKLINIERGGQQ